MLEDVPRARRVLVLLVVAEVAAVVALHRLGGVDGFAIPRHDLGRWLRQTPSEDVLLAGLRLAALVAAWWLLGSTLLYIGARVARLHSAAHALGWATLPAVRRWADRAAAVSIVAASALGAARPAGADPPPATTTPAPVVVDVDHRDRATLPDLPPPTTEPLPRATVPPVVPVVPVVPVTPPPTAPAPRPEATHTVTAGEHLWSIAAATVAARTGRSAETLSPAEVAPYWGRVVEDNRDRLRSGNPSLVYPGEVLELPPL
ncbi:MAG TPA: hypothetical protein VKH36_01370 [Acidimicrobiia bacterium]|nr:hypothetical protein [Acidimicrobiia bacterium]